MTQTIEFFWDAVSPYTYLAAGQIEALARETGATLRWRPILLGGVMKASGNRPPLSVPQKGRYMFTDLRREAALLGVGFTVPPNFPPNTLSAQRMATALGDEPHSAARFARALMAACWRDGRDIGNPDELGAICTNFGLDAEDMMARAQQQDVKDALRASTEEAVARGAFGAPTFFVGETMFWGHDRLGHLRAYLAGRLPE